METRPISRVLAPALVAVSVALDAWNWYLRSDRILAWSAVMILLGGMALALRMANRNSTSARSTAQWSPIRHAVVFAGLMLFLALTATLVKAFGATPDASLSPRGTMVVFGAFLAFLGNATPKTLTPLSTMRGDPAAVQALQRFSGWTWVLAGLAFATAWIVLPLGLAQTVSTATVLIAMILIGLEIVSLRRNGVPGGPQ